MVIFNPFFHFSFDRSILPFKPNATTFTAMAFYTTFMMPIFTCKDGLFTTAIAVKLFIFNKFQANQLQRFYIQYFPNSMQFNRFVDLKSLGGYLCIPFKPVVTKKPLQSLKDEKGVHICRGLSSVGSLLLANKI